MSQLIPGACIAPLLVASLLAQDRFAPLRKDHLPHSTMTAFGHLAFDLDQDGDLDLVEFDRFGLPRLLEQTARGIFVESAQSPIQTGPSFWPRGGAAADFDGDGSTDLLLVLGGNLAQLWMNQAGQLVLAPAASLPRLGDLVSFSVPVGDLDGDGDIDVLAGDQLWRNDGSARFTAVPNGIAAGSGTVSEQILVDVDRDADLDVVQTFFPAGQAELWIGDGTGRFALASGALPAGLAPTSMASGDFDGDGAVDLIAVSYTGPGRLLRNDGSGRFRDVADAAIAATTGGQAKALDFDGDGRLDVIVPQLDRAGLLQNRNGGFVDVSNLVVGWENARTLLTVDIDGDGDPDLLAAFGLRQQRRLWLNHDAGRRFLDAGEQLDLVNQYAFADLDGDGLPDCCGFGPRSAERRIALNDGTGRFFWQDAGFLPARWRDANPLALIRAGDLDGDGDQDLLRADLDALAWARNDGAARFVEDPASPLATPGQTTDLLVFDVDRDGDLDAVRIGGFAPISAPGEVYLNDGAGNLARGARLPSASSDTSSAVGAFGDVDGDGDVDIVRAEIGGTVPNNLRIAILVNDGLGNFSAGASFASAPGGYGSVSLADIEADGDLDLLALDTLFENRSGSFVDITASLPGVPTRGLLVDADADGDADIQGIDLLFVNDGAGRFADASSNLPRGTMPLAIDVDGDGDLDLRGEDSLFANLARQLRVPYIPRLGGTLDVDVHATPGFAPTGESAVVLLAPRIARIDLGPIGTLRIDPLSMVILAIAPISDPVGRARVTVQVPNVAALSGVTVHLQALIVSGTSVADLRLTNRASELLMR